MVQLHADVNGNLSALLPHTLPHISSECVVFQSSEVFSFCYICGDASLSRAACDNYSRPSAAEMFIIVQMDVMPDFIAHRYVA